jgi:hypothetical protein
LKLIVNGRAGRPTIDRTEVIAEVSMPRRGPCVAETVEAGTWAETTAHGRLTLAVLGGLAEFERT